MSRLSVGLQKTALIVDTDQEAMAALREHLENVGMRVETAATGMAGMALAHQRPPDIALLELNSPEVDGNVLCRTLRMNRETAAVPIIILSSSDDAGERARSFACGADEFLVKPIAPDELVLRVRAFLRWSRTTAADGHLLRVDEFSVDSDALKVYLNKRLLDLTFTELRLLLVLLSDPGRVHSRKSLLSAVWGNKTLQESRAVDTCMRRLRGKLDSYAARFETLRGIGYRYRSPQA